MLVCVFICIFVNVFLLIVLFDESIVLSYVLRKLSGMEMMFGLESGMNGLLVNIVFLDGFYILGFIDISISVLIRFVRLFYKVFVVLNFF